MKPPYRRYTEIGFRLFFLANLVGTLWYVTSQILRIPRPARAYVDAIELAAAWIVGIVLMVHFAEWQARRRERRQQQLTS